MSSIDLRLLRLLIRILIGWDHGSCSIGHHHHVGWGWMLTFRGKGWCYPNSHSVACACFNHWMTHSLQGLRTNYDGWVGSREHRRRSCTIHSIRKLPCAYQLLIISTGCLSLWGLILLFVLWAPKYSIGYIGYVCSEKPTHWRSTICGIGTRRRHGCGLSCMTVLRRRYHMVLLIGAFDSLGSSAERISLDHYHIRVLFVSLL